jgi:mannose-6-phosphate isomerase
MAETDLPHRGRDERPWGGFEQFTKSEVSTVKILTVRAGAQFSLQRHKSRDEFWRILSGSGTVTVGDVQHPVQAGGEFFIPHATLHRAKAGDNDLQILEISFGEFDESDIERLEDDYGRT